MAVPTIPWISIATDLFESPKIKEILDMENGELIVLYWIKLLLFCGRENNGGVLTRGNGKPYSRNSLYSNLRSPDPTTGDRPDPAQKRAIFDSAMDIFAELDMVEVGEDGTIEVPGWSEHQNLAKYEALKAAEEERLKRDRERKREERRKKAESDSCPTDVLDCPGQSRTEDRQSDGQVDTEEEKEEELILTTNTSTTTTASERIDYQGIIALYNQHCQSLPKCVKLTDGRRKAIKARINGGYTVEDFGALFRMAGESSFLRGQNKNNWTADIDWLLKDNNMAKVLEGKYADRNGGGGAPSGPRYDYSDTEGSF